ncbi:MAG TPA: tetrathionate reductase subunit TtrA [Sulfurospirillum sp. UBA12182]|nr:MAG TPA: tetrathionate reductase subunit TtrA [Sulfurospirillum sp. UBA12182]
MEKSRRNFLLGTGVAATSLSLVGYSDTLKHTLTLSDRGVKAKDSIYVNAALPECKVVDGDVSLSKKFTITPSVCNGCTTHCAVRVKIDNESKKVVRIFGNPYSLLSSDPWINYKTPLKESFKLLSAYKESGLEVRSTVCARGNLVHEKLNDPFRVTKPLKRVGKRGENKWQTISIEQLIQEVVNGGDLFGEGNVEGLKAFCDTKTPLDPNNPDYGPLANKLCILGTGDEGRQNFIVHRFSLGFGTANFMGHTATCGLSMRSGEAAYLNDFVKYPHLKPDFEHCEYLLNIATAPAQAGNPFKRQAKLLAHARVEKNLHYTTVTPTLTNSDAFAAQNRSSWVPIKPGGDLALVMGMIRYIIENRRYNEEYLCIPSEDSQNKLNDVSHTNASHLVIQSGEKEGFFLVDEKGEALVIDTSDNTLKPASLVLQGDIYFEGEVSYLGENYSVKSSFNLLKENAFALSLDEYAKESGIAKDTIQELAVEFTSHGRAVATDCHGGTMHTTGFYTTYAIMMLGALVGNLNHKGGMSAGGGKFKNFDGAKYNLLAYKGKNKPQGTRIDRARKPYEKSSEYKRKVESGQNPYPAKDNWYPFTNALQTEVITSSANEYPYKLGALISWNANFIYAQSGSKNLEPLLKDPKKAVPLFVAIDPFINETSKFADYIVPDSVLFETWGVVSPWSGYLTKANHVRFPILESPNAKFANGEPISMDSFIIELGKALGLKSFGENAIASKDGQFYPLHKPEDFYLRAFENIAIDGKEPVSEISDEELQICGLEKYIASLQSICKENWRRVAYVMSRGGRFASKQSAYDGDKMNASYKKAIAIYNEKVGTSKNALTGERYSGTPKYYPSRYCDGTKIKVGKNGYELLAFSYKSNVLSSATAALEKLREIRYTTYIDINPATAKKYGISHGDEVMLSSFEQSIKGIARFKEGTHPLSVGVEHGGGREGEGAVHVKIDGKSFEGKIERKSGVFLNKLGLLDHTKLGIATLSDFAVGSNARQAIPVKIEKI